MGFLNLSNEYLDVSKLRFTPKVYQEKRSLCQRFAKYLKRNRSVAEIQTKDINRYLMIQARNRSANAANKDRKNLMAMFNWLVKTHGLESNPVMLTDRFAHDREPQYTPPTEDVLRVLAVTTREERVFLDCYLQTGARRSEIFRLTWDDVNFQKREIRLGTRKTRDGSMEYEWLPMSSELYESLWWWWNNRTFKDKPWVFVCDRAGEHYGKPYKYRQWFMSGLCTRADVKPFGFHALRRYVASYLADTKKVSAKTIQRVLRHKNISTTERYIHNINNDLEVVMEMLSEKNPPHSPSTKEEKADGE